MKVDLDWAKEAPTRKQLLLGGGHLAALWAITFVQPLLDLLGKNPDFFVARGNSPGDILILTIGFTLLPPLVMLAVEWVATKIAPQVYYAIHFLFFWGIAAFLFVQILSNLFERPTILLVLLSLVLGALFAYAVFKVVFIKNLMDILIIAPAVILLLFIFASDATKAIFPEEESVDIGATVKSKTPVVMVVMDELGTSTLMTKQGEIDAKRFPNFSKLEKEATWYPNQSTTSYFTPTAVPGILTGNVPDEGALPTASDQPNNIFALLSGSYKFHVEEPITSICPTSLCPDEEGDTRQLERLKSLYSDLKYVEGRLVLPPRIADTLPDVGTNFEGFGGGGGDEKKGSIDDLFVKGRGGAKAPSVYSDFINAIPAGDSNLTMMHIKQPHQPWKYDVDGVEYNHSPIDQLSNSTNTWKVDENGVATSQARQIVQTGFADNLLGQVMNHLKKNGTWDRAMVVVMADHGVDFQGGDIPQRMAGTESMGEVANPPLFIKYPGQKKGVKDPIHSMTLDVVPTIAQELGVDGMYETDGVPLQSDDVPERDVTVKDVKNRSYSLPIEDVIEQRDAAISEKDRRFGTGPFYTLGPAPELIGKPAPAVSGSATEVTLDQAQIWDDYKPGKGLIPIFVNGTIDGGNAGDTIAVGVNGKIQGTTNSFDFEGSQHFGTLVDPDSLVPGRNEITVYRVGPKNKLTPIGSN